ncbi:MAG: SNF2-related protein [Deltaproteobacteria bacterium]
MTRTANPQPNRDAATVPTPLHPAQRRYLAEDLVRRRRSDEHRRYASPQRAAKIDANPHQINAVVFALGRLREGGCILADEVGLGKTIEAGLVIAQLLAEGAPRILLIAPKPLLGQWRQELFQLFDIEAHEGAARPGGFDGTGVFLIGREAAGSEKGELALMAAEAFDLWVVDEAHEMFAGIYKRFNSYGAYEPDSPHARTAGRVRRVLLERQIPVLLLTATPIQNTLLELWGLVQYVDPLGTLLGDLPTFREVFCEADHRQVTPGQELELRTRLQSVLQRTLRREAQEFLEVPFVNRQARLFEYMMLPDEKALYDDVTRYLLEPGILGFQGSQRQLLLLSFHRLMASSVRALGKSLSRVATRLRGQASSADKEVASNGGSIATELEDDDFADALAESDTEWQGGDEPQPVDPENARTELRRVESFIQRAETLGSDSKFQALLKALDFVMARATRGQGAGKLVIFTESLVTQEYLREGLLESRLVTDAEVTLFRGNNNSERARVALRHWREERTEQEGVMPSPGIAVRMALVHEFRTRSKVFISTEAGAKGLNLQFCDTIVNYDLPWNPQRIEQRIGRCHRYGQQHDVTVINFLAKDNEAQALTFEILSQKLELFGTVLDASDHVLHQSSGPGVEVLATALGPDFEAQLRRVYERARTLEEVSAELRALRDKVAEGRRRFEETRTRTEGLIVEQFDEGVRRRFRQYQEQLPGALAELDRALLTLVLSYLEARGIAHTRRVTDGIELLEVPAHSSLPAALQGGLSVALGGSKEHVSLHTSHPLVLAAVADARQGKWSGRARVTLAPDAPAALACHAGKAGRLRLLKVAFDGFEPVELLVPVVVLENGELLESELGEALLGSTIREEAGFDSCALAAGAPPPWASEDVLEDAAEEALFAVQARLDVAEGARFTQALQQAERFVDDQRFVWRRRQSSGQAQLEKAQVRRDGATNSESRTTAERELRSAQTVLDEIQAALERLEHRDDDRLRQFDAHIHARRSAPPRVERLFDLDLVIE